MSTTLTSNTFGEYDRGWLHYGQSIDAKNVLGQKKSLKEALQLAQQHPGSEAITWEKQGQQSTFTVHSSSVHFKDQADIQTHANNVARNVLAFVADNDETALNYASAL